MHWCIPLTAIFFCIAEALASGFSVDEINRLTWVDKWFLSKMKNIVDMDKELEQVTESWRRTGAGSNPAREDSRFFRFMDCKKNRSYGICCSCVKTSIFDKALRQTSR